MGASSMLLENLAWSLAGLVMGYALGTIVCRLKGHYTVNSTGSHGHPELDAVQAKVDKADQVPEVHLHTVRPGRARDTFVALLLVLFAVGTLLSSAVAVVRAEAQAEAQAVQAACQEQVNEAFETALAERVVAAGQDRMAITDLISEVARVQSDPVLVNDPAQRRVVFLAAIARYQGALKDAESKRTAAPLPAQNLCG